MGCFLIMAGNGGGKITLTSSSALSSSLWPGLILCTAIASLSSIAHNAIIIGGQNAVSAVVIAILAGMLLRSVIGLPVMLAKGITYCYKTLLRLAIVLMGINFSFFTVLRESISVLPSIIITVAAALLVMEIAGILLKLRPPLARLIGIGTAICGASAIIATAPIIDDVEESDIFYAVATITFFGVLAIFIFPFVGVMLGLSELQFGRWAGLAIHETAQVLAAGFIYGDEAGSISALVKLTRTLMLVPLIIALVWFSRKGKAGEGKNIDLKNALPLFILGFLGIALLRTGVDLFFAQAEPWLNIQNLLNGISKFLIVIAMAAIGYSTNINTIRSLGIKPLLGGLLASIFIGSFSLLLLLLLF